MTMCHDLVPRYPRRTCTLRVSWICSPLQTFRDDEGVDIEALAAGGYKVGTIAKNEFLRYSVEVAEEDGTRLESKNNVFFAAIAWNIAALQWEHKHATG